MKMRTITTDKKIQRTLDRLNRIKTLTLTGYTNKVTTLGTESNVDNGFVTYLINSKILLNEHGKNITWNNKIPITFSPLAEKCYNEYYAVKRKYPMNTVKTAVTNKVQQVNKVETVKRTYTPKTTNVTTVEKTSKKFSFGWGLIEYSW